MALVTQNPRLLMLEIAESAEFFGLTHPRKWPKPGEYYEHLPPEVKKVLTNLKSADIKNARWPLWK